MTKKNGYQYNFFLLKNIISVFKNIIFSSRYRKYYLNRLKDIKINLRDYRKVKTPLLYLIILKYFPIDDNIIQSVFFNKKRMLIKSSFWYLHSLHELFIEEVYKFHSKKKEPIIIDCGSNIGLSLIYFTIIYPESKIIGFEIDNEIYQMSIENLSQYNHNNIKINNKAVWTCKHGVYFHPDGALGGKIIPIPKEKSKNKVSSIRLKNLLKSKIDFLKLDVEGAEFEILKDCQHYLINVENLFVEYHSPINDEQCLSDLLSIIKHAGFRYYIRAAWENMESPFSEKNAKYNFDLQLNIFCYRI